MRSNQSLLILALSVALVLSAVGPAAGHASEEIDGNELTFGGADEPVVTGERTWLELSITDEDDEPVTDLADDLEWRIEKPGDVDAVALSMEEQYGSPGVYETAVVFTEPGEYVVHVEGMIDDTEVHTHFDVTVEDHTALQYPEDNRVDELEAELEHQHEGLHDLEAQVETQQSELEHQHDGLHELVERVEELEDDTGTQTAALPTSGIFSGIVLVVSLAIGGWFVSRKS